MMIYGTAWKENDTARCVREALAAGFRAVDTANQRKHYFEAAVGEAIAGFPRDQLWLQTKFTFQNGQDDRLPYDPKAPLGKQVEQSVQSSLEHLRTSFIDSYVLHGPARRFGWTHEDDEVWAAMEAAHGRRLVRALGISNVSIDQLDALCAKAKVQPSCVQNRCYARTGWDARMRAACKHRGITYQGFSLLTANPEAVAEAEPLARQLGKTPEQIVFAQAVQLSIVPLTGTTNPKHMREDLEAVKLNLSSR